MRLRDRLLKDYASTAAWSSSTPTTLTVSDGFIPPATLWGEGWRGRVRRLLKRPHPIYLAISAGTEREEVVRLKRGGPTTFTVERGLSAVE